MLMIPEDFEDLWSPHNLDLEPLISPLCLAVKAGEGESVFGTGSLVSIQKFVDVPRQVL